MCVGASPSPFGVLGLFVKAVESMLWQILSLLVALYATKVLMSRWKYDLHKVPSPPGLPILGHTLEFFYGQPSHQIAQWIGRRMRQLGNTKLMRVCQSKALCGAEGDA